MMKLLLSITLTMVLLCSLGASLAAAADAPAAPDKPAILGVGATVKDFTLPKIDGSQVNFMKDIKGKTKFTAIAFANTTCITCVQESKGLNILVGENPDLTAYVVMVDARGGEAAKVFKEAYKLDKLIYLLDPEMSVPPAYGFTFTPALILLDKDGKIILTKAGFEDTYITDIKNSLK